jgi:UDP:flavonoid glycosyltransferase YjiC (YdhE family)
MGTGFTVPPIVYPLPNLRFWLKPDQEELRRSEDFTLNIMNGVLERLRVPPLNHLSDLWESATQILTTFKELDPYQDRKNADYYGTSASPMGEDPSWPEGKGKKIFAYLKPFPTLPALLSALDRLQMPSIVYVDRLPDKLKEKFAASTMKFVSAPQDMGKIASQCDMAILNGTHNTSANLLLAGKPALHLPIYLEQFLTAHKIEKLGAGLSAPTLRPEEMTAKLEMILRSNSYAEGAQRFESRYGGMGAAVQDERVLKVIEGLLAS